MIWERFLARAKHTTACFTSFYDVEKVVLLSVLHSVRCLLLEKNWTCKVLHVLAASCKKLGYASELCLNVKGKLYILHRTGKEPSQ